jgi:hypothetical protein
MTQSHRSRGGRAGERFWVPVVAIVSCLAAVGWRDMNVVAANAHDNFENAVAIAPGALPFTTSQDLSQTEAALQAGEPTRTTEGCANTASPRTLNQHTVWYSFTPAAARSFVAHTFGSGDTVLAVFRAGNPDTLANLQRVACNDNAQRDTEGTQSFEHSYSQVVFEGVANTKYYFQIGGLGGSAQLTFRLAAVQNAALLVLGNEHAPQDLTKLEEALRKSPLWSHSPIVYTEFPTDGELRAAITQTYAGVPADGISLFVYSGHGNKMREAGDPDENNAGNDRRDELILTRQAITDDRLGELFQGVPGRKVLVFDSCYSGGLVDGTSDFRGPGRAVPGIFLLASRPDQESRKGLFQWGVAGSTRQHSYFSGALILGLARRDAGAGVRADGIGGDRPDGRVTVREWFAFAAQETGAIITERNARVTPAAAQDPLLDESRAPAGSRADDVVIFSHALDTTELLEYHRFPLPAPFTNGIEADEGLSDTTGCEACCEDFGDAPDPLVSTPGRYPTLKDHAGARHANAPDGCPTCGALFSFEWLGVRVDGEQEADPERPAADLDKDGHPGDAFDDGVEFELISPSLIRVRVRVSVFDPQAVEADETPRYERASPGKRLYLNAWADWNGDGVWAMDEQVIGGGPGAFAIDPREDPQFTPDASGVFTFDVPVPTVVSREFYFRFRLDYGEDAGEVQRLDPGLDQVRGTARFGEVEDYCDVAGLVPLFAGTSPPVSGSTALLSLNSQPSISRLFRWRSSDSVVGTVDTNVMAASTWNYFPGSTVDPARLVYVGRSGNLTLQANVLFAPYNRAVVDLVSGGRRIRYLLNLTTCGEATGVR